MDTTAIKRAVATLLISCILLSSLLLPCPAYADTTAVAVDLTPLCHVSADNHAGQHIKDITDTSVFTDSTFFPYERVSISWAASVPVRAVLISFHSEPPLYQILQYDENDALLSEQAGPAFVNGVVYVSDQTRRVTFVSIEHVRVCELYAYGEGTIPNVHPWQPIPEKLDYLVIGMHPDDETLFMGAIVPMYGSEEGKCGSVLVMATRNRNRKNEALNAIWTLGLRSYPILETFPDLVQCGTKGEVQFSKELIVKRLVSVIRKRKPEVIFTHDLQGEYGHWQHKRLSESVLEAVLLATDSSYDPESYALYGTWTVKKLYLHLYPKNRLQLKVTAPLTSFGGRNAVDVAREAFRCHASQTGGAHQVTNRGVYSLSDYGLAYTTVGYDTDGVNDPFEHVDPTSLHGHVALKQVRDAVERTLARFLGTWSS